MKELIFGFANLHLQSNMFRSKHVHVLRVNLQSKGKNSTKHCCCWQWRKQSITSPGINTNSCHTFKIFICQHFWKQYILVFHFSTHYFVSVYPIKSYNSSWSSWMQCDKMWKCSCCLVCILKTRQNQCQHRHLSVFMSLHSDLQNLIFTYLCTFTSALISCGKFILGYNIMRLCIWKTSLGQDSASNSVLTRGT